MRLLREHGHEVAAYQLVRDEPASIRALIEHAGRNDAVQAIIINGGTGISKRDSTFETVTALLEKKLDGFGELFRYLSYKDIGSSA
ncbi:MAG: MogA/MoaB family molybdenum cofactor biosynthesis protein, partial [Nitrospiraceae bacterium]